MNHKKDPIIYYRDQVRKINELLQRSDFDRAEHIAKNLQGKYPRDANANLLVAQSLAAKKNNQGAIPFAELARDLAPFHPGTTYFLGRLYLECELYEKAAPLLFESLEKAPQSALLHMALADMYSEINQGENAVKHYEIALGLPANAVLKQQIKSLYARSLSTVNRLEDAEKQYDEMKGTVVGMQAHSLSLKSKDQRLKDVTTLSAEIRDELSSDELTLEDRILLLHALGDVYERSKKYDEAFVEWQNSRSLNNDKYAIDAYVGTVDNLIRFYNKDLIDSLAQFGDASERPIFIFGMARSGTTLAEQIIAAHKDGYGIGELGRMSRLELPFFNQYCENRSTKEVISDAKNGLFKRNAENYLNLLKAIVPTDAARVVDKAVAQFLSAGFSHVCFPKAKFIHCNRHPADSFVSAFQNRLHHGYVANQEHYAKYYLGKEKLVAHWKTCFPENIFDLNYEKLVQDPEPTVRNLIAFLGLEWDPTCMKFFEQKSTVKTFSLQQVRQPIYTSSVYRWTKYEKHLGPLFAALAEAGFTYPEF